MQDRLRTPEGKAQDRQPKPTVEPVFGQIKDARGFRRFSLAMPFTPNHRSGARRAAHLAPHYTTSPLVA
jgi:hypothetical protein